MEKKYIFLQKIMFFSGMVCLLPGCDSIKETMGVRKTMPDTFSVDPSAQPLEIPPDLSVCPPPEHVEAPEGVRKKENTPPLSPQEEALFKKTEGEDVPV